MDNNKITSIAGNRSFYKKSNKIECKRVIKKQKKVADIETILF
jgi:hypothetical protein